MLKINLLPVRQLQIRHKAQRQFMGMVFLLFLVLGLLAAVGYWQTSTISELQATKSQLEQERRSFDKKLAEIKKHKKQTVEFERKIGIIKTLRKNSSLTVRVLDEVANRIDNQRLWLTSLEQQNSSLKLAGVALDNQTIAQFMDSLKASPLVNEVNLTNSSLKAVSGRDLKSFSLTCAVSLPAETDSKAEKPKLKK